LHTDIYPSKIKTKGNSIKTIALCFYYLIPDKLLKSLSGK
jgi:hypothetical protein